MGKPLRKRESGTFAAFALDAGLPLYDPRGWPVHPETVARAFEIGMVAERQGRRRPANRYACDLSGVTEWDGGEPRFTEAFRDALWRHAPSSRIAVAFHPPAPTDVKTPKSSKASPGDPTKWWAPEGSEGPFVLLCAREARRMGADAGRLERLRATIRFDDLDIVLEAVRDPQGRAPRPADAIRALPWEVRRDAGPTAARSRGTAIPQTFLASESEASPCFAKPMAGGAGAWRGALGAMEAMGALAPPMACVDADGGRIGWMNITHGGGLDSSIAFSGTGERAWRTTRPRADDVSAWFAEAVQVVEARFLVDGEQGEDIFLETLLREPRGSATLEAAFAGALPGRLAPLARRLLAMGAPRDGALAMAARTEEGGKAGKRAETGLTDEGKTHEEGR